MSQARHVGKVVVSNTLAISGPLQAMRDGGGGSGGGGGTGQGRVVINGGTGSLGVLMAGWLAEGGCKDIVLIGRSGRVSGEALGTLVLPWTASAPFNDGAGGAPIGAGEEARRVASLGGSALQAAVSVVACDGAAAGDLDALSGITDAAGDGIRRFAVPATAVFHAGGVLADATLQNQVWFCTVSG